MRLIKNLMMTTIYKDENISAQKKLLRREMNTRLANLSVEERVNLSRAVVEKFLAHPIYQNSKVIMAYLSTSEEIQLQEFLLIALADKKILAVPFIEGREMYAAMLPSLNELEVGAYGILTVKSDCRKIIDAAKIDGVITPGLAFDVHGGRLGKGGGFYDKFLSRAINAKKVALAYDFQIVDEVPMEPHDLTVDFFITPTKNFLIRLTN
ncbi:MAG: 5-formyltetrahydrofolate cyclo-ligase [Selenomonadaceae bacterium]|nr:5-formyltetrahydrofolate cyclo-ligase [Selenomonadaceae bacterium]